MTRPDWSAIQQSGSAADASELAFSTFIHTSVPTGTVRVCVQRPCGAIWGPHTADDPVQVYPIVVGPDWLPFVPSCSVWVMQHSVGETSDAGSVCAVDTSATAPRTSAGASSMIQPQLRWQMIFDIRRRPMRLQVSSRAWPARNAGLYGILPRSLGPSGPRQLLR